MAADQSDGASATLGGVPLLQNQVLDWPLRAGVAPSERIFLLAPEDAATLLAGGNTGSTNDGGNQITVNPGPAGNSQTTTGGGGSGPISLVVTPSGGAETRTTRGLYVLGVAPSPDPRHRAVRVSDRRFLWPRAHVVRRFNWRRRTGDVGLVAGTLATAQFAQSVGYAAFSTHDGGGTFWTAAEILKNVIAAVDPGLNIADDAKLASRGALRLEGMVFDDPGDEAIARAFAAIPGFEGYLDDNDNYVLLDTADGRAADVLKALGDPTTQAGIAVLVDTPGLRPAFIDVLFEREIEARIDSLEGATTSRTPHFLESIADNVLEVTDQTLVLADRTVAMGTYITFAEFFAAMAALPASAYPPNMRARGIKLDQTFLQATWFGGLAAYNMSFGGLGEDPVWLRRLGSCFLHFRQTFRITRALMDRFLTVQARRVGLVDVPTGIAANAQVFAYHALYARQKTTAYTTQAAGAPYATNVAGWSATLAGATPSPGVVSIVDGDVGIFRVQYGLAQAAAFGAQVIPSAVLLKSGADPSATAGGVGLLLTDMQLSAFHKLAVVLTITPAAPNSKKQLHRVRVLPSEAEPYLGQKVGAAGGPGLEVRIPGSLLPARVPWQDGASFAALVEQALGMDTAGGDPDDKYVDLPVMNGTDLTALAQATAAAYWALYLPQHEGTQAGYWNPKVVPAGRALQVTHRLDPKGRASTVVTTTRQTIPRDPISALPDSVRATVLRFAKVAVR